MTSYIYYILIVIGVSYFITQSLLLKPLREYISIYTDIWIIGKLDGVVNCIYCASFWVGIGISVLYYKNIDLYTILNAFSCMGALYVIHNIFNKD